MRFCDFLNKMYERFPCSNQGQFVLEIFSALCGETDPISSNHPCKYMFSNCLPSGLCGTDPTSRKRLYGTSSRYKGLTTPIKKHIKTHANKHSFIGYCEANVSVEHFRVLCDDFGVSTGVDRSLFFESIFEMFSEFSRSATDSASDIFVSAFVINRLMNPPEKTLGIEKNKTATPPICAEDDFLIVRQSPLHPHTVKFYDCRIWKNNNND